MPVKVVAVLLAGLLAGGVSQAQDRALASAPATPGEVVVSEIRSRTLSVRECLDIARSGSPLLDSLEAERLLAEGARQEVSAATRPQIDTAGSYRHWDRQRVGMLGIAPTERQFYDCDLSELRVTLRQLLWDGDQARKRRQAAGLQVKSKEALVTRTREEIGAEVLAQALGVFTAEALLKAAGKTLDDIRATLEKMQAMEAVGRVPHVDVLRIQTRVQEVLEMQEGYRQARATILARLSTILGRSETIDELTNAGLPELRQELASDVERLVLKALEQRTDLAAMRLAIRGANRQEQAQRRGNQPQVFLNTTVNRYGDQSGWGREIGFIGAEFQWVLEDGGRNRGKATQAISQRQAALARLRQAELKAAEQVRVAFVNLHSMRVRLERNQANLVMAEEAFRIEQVKYEQGKGTINDVLDAEAAMFQAEAQVIRSRNESLAAQIALDLAMEQKTVD